LVRRVGLLSVHALPSRSTIRHSRRGSHTLRLNPLHLAFHNLRQGLQRHNLQRRLLHRILRP
jgi:hypothetical protein